MSELVRRLFGAQPTENTLGLSSRRTLPKEVEREVEREEARSIGRGRVLKTDLHVLRHVGLVGFEVLEDVTMLAEQAARRNPYERAGFDALRDTLAIAVTNKIIEASGLNP